MKNIPNNRTILNAMLSIDNPERVSSDYFKSISEIKNYLKEEVEKMRMDLRESTFSSLRYFRGPLTRAIQEFYNYSDMEFKKAGRRSLAELTQDMIAGGELIINDLEDFEKIPYNFLDQKKGVLINFLGNLVDAKNSLDDNHRLALVA